MCARKTGVMGKSGRIQFMIISRVETQRVRDRYFVCCGGHVYPGEKSDGLVEDASKQRGIPTVIV